MDFPTVQAQLTDLPSTFKRPGTPFTEWMDSLSAGLARGTTSVDGLLAAAQNFANAQFGWIDVWGLLVGIPRMSNEPNVKYSARIAYSLIAGAGTPVGIALWILFIFGISVTVTDSKSAVGYAIAFPAGVTQAQIAAILNSLGKIRPAGVPFTVGQASAGTFLDTINFLDSPRSEGAFLSGSTAGVALPIPGTTNNIPQLLPGLLLSDPTLNPSLA